MLQKDKTWFTTEFLQLSGIIPKGLVNFLKWASSFSITSFWMNWGHIRNYNSCCRSCRRGNFVYPYSGWDQLIDKAFGRQRKCIHSWPAPALLTTPPPPVFHYSAHTWCFPHGVLLTLCTASLITLNKQGKTCKLHYILSLTYITFGYVLYLKIHVWSTD